MAPRVINLNVSILLLTATEELRHKNRRSCGEHVRWRGGRGDAGASPAVAPPRTTMRRRWRALSNHGDVTPDTIALTLFVAMDN